MSTAKLTTHQQHILARLKNGDSPKQIAAAAGTSTNNIYQTRRRLVASGHLPEAGRKSARKPRATAAVGRDASVDPVVVVERRIEIVTADIDHLAELVAQGASQLRELSEEAARLSAAHDALTA